MVIGEGFLQGSLSEATVRQLAAEALERADVHGKRVLVIIPDHTRSAPISHFFRLLHSLLWGRVAALDYLVALGTHQALSDLVLNRLVGITAAERATRYAGVHISNHRWDLPETFTQLGTITAEDTRGLSNGMLALDVPVRINRMVLDYDHVIICGPVFPHEVVGFSGGNKYFFPGVSGQEMIDVTHWLGALLTSMAIIGVRDTPVRRMIDRAAALIPTPRTCFAMVVAHRASERPDSSGAQPVVEGLAGLYIGSPEKAWAAAVDLSERLQITYVDQPFRRVLSVMPAMYDDLWVGAKGMYKLEPVVADGGEVIIYAPHITEVSYTHGRVIDQVGYHVRDYFVKQWDHFQHFPWGVLAHSTHLRGVGTYEDGVERPRIQVTLATGIPKERCRRINLGYVDPKTIDPQEWAGREGEGILLVRKAGEMLYRVRSISEEGKSWPKQNSV